MKQVGTGHDWLELIACGWNWLELVDSFRIGWNLSKLVRTDLRNVHKLLEIFITGCKWSEQERICWNWLKLAWNCLELQATA